MKKIILPKLPFDIGAYLKKGSKYPQSLKFHLVIDKSTGLIYEKMDKKIRESLKIYYSEGGYGSTPLGESEFSSKQADELFRYISQSIKANNKNIKNISCLEIGSSYGCLLFSLKQKGVKKVLGIEPGDEGKTGSRKYKVSVIQDFFPSKKLKEKYDLIYSHCVLEHIENPVHILKHMHKNLNDNGIVFIAVPDCEKKLAVGDFSIISHQHVNYFTKDSLREIFKKTGFRHIKIITSKKRSLLIGWATKGDAVESIKKPDNRKLMQESVALYSLFGKNFLKNKKNIQHLVNKFEKENKSIGFYAPCSNLIGLINFKISPRIFNSDAYKHGKYIAGSKNPFESPKNIKKHPVDILFVAPIDYDREIKEFLIKNKYIKKEKIISIKNIYENISGIKYKVGY